MKNIVFVIILMFFSIKSYGENFGFIYSWGNVHTYNSFTKTYIRKICAGKDSYSINLNLSKSDLNQIKNDLDDSNFFRLPANYLENYKNNERVEVTMPCAQKKLFVQSDEKTHYMVFNCKTLPIASLPGGAELLELEKNIETMVESSVKYSNAPKSQCFFE